MKKITLIIFLFSTTTFAKTNTELWLNFKGITECKPGNCAELIPNRPLELALDYFKNNSYQFSNQKFMAIIDYSQDSNQKRFYMLNLRNGSVRQILVSHGKNSEIEKSMASKFSNVIGSEMSSIGFYKTDFNTYVGKHGRSLKLYGLSETNSNALDRNIVIHAADYATEWFSKEKGRLGLSQGCPAVSPGEIKYVLDRLIGEGLLFIYAPAFEKAAKK